MFLRRLRDLTLACALGAGSVFGVAQSFPVDAAGAPPACRYDDVAANHTAYSDWDVTLVDTIYKLPRRYVPPGLVSTSLAGLQGGGLIRKIAIPDLAALAKAAQRAGAGVRVVSAYRSYDYQVWLYDQEVQDYGRYRADPTVARPGHSEHQLGVTIDFGSASTGGGPSVRFGQSAAGRWMKYNAWKFGWVMSYPAGETSKTCYASEPWHFRYVGRDMAAQLHANHLTLREYLWRRYQ